MHSEFIPFHKPAIGEEEVRSVVETLKSGWLTTGSKVKSFEEDFARYVGSKHAIAVNSGTAALHLALDAVGIKEGDEVIVPTMTFTATAEVVLYFKAKPVLVDCERDTLNLDPAKIEAAITPRTKAIVPVHMAGQPCDMDEILKIARKHDLRVIEDAAHALPAGYRGRTVGTIGDITCFSFYATKTITTGEGGMATTENPKWAERMRIMSLHGISHDAWKRYTKEGSWYYEVLYPGFKYNLTDLAAAIGSGTAKEMQRILASAATNRDDLRESLRRARRRSNVPACRNDVQHAWHLFVIQLDLDRLKINRNQFIEALREKEIGTSVHFIPLHLHPYYRDKFGYKPADFPNASAVFERIFSLPIYPKMSESDVERVIEAVKTTAQQYRR